MKDAVSALKDIEKNKIGSKVVDRLRKSANVFTVVEAQKKSEFIPNDKKKGAGVGTLQNPSQYASIKAAGKLADYQGGASGTIPFNTDGTPICVVGGYSQRNPTVDLFHEMAHGFDSDMGLLNALDHNGVRKQEWQAVYCLLGTFISRC